MKIAINCCYYGETSGGIKEYIYNLVTNLLAIDKENSYIFYVSLDDIEFWERTMPQEADYRVFPFKRNEKFKRSLRQNRFWIKEHTREQFDIFHSPFFYIPTLPGCKKIMTVHDLRFRRYPRSYTLLRRLFVRYAFQKSLRNVDRIITVSEFTKKEITEFYNIDPGKIIPIHEAVDQKRFSIDFDDKQILKELGLEERNYLFTVGHLEPRKNYPLLIEVIDELNRDSSFNHKLVIVGKKNYKYEETVARIESSRNTLYLDFVKHETLLALYKNALLFLFPSIYEGFGFPPLEAAQFGVPAAVSNVSSIPEITGKGAVYYDPLSKQDMIRGIKEAIRDREKLVKLARENLKRFSWRSTAEQTITLYEELLTNEPN